MGERAQGLGRSRRLFAAFRVEQTDPARFYTLLAEDSVALLRQHVDLAGSVVLDVGAGPVHFARAFAGAGARYGPLDHDESVESVGRGGIVGSALQLPIASGSVDVVFCSNLLEHVEHPEQAADELVRVTRPGGVVFLSYTNWLSPWGGHETSPYHWLGGRRAIRHYERRHGHPPKNRVGETLFRISVRRGLDWAAGCREVDVLSARPRYLPPGARRLLAVPGIREVLTWNLLLVLRRR